MIDAVAKMRVGEKRPIFAQITAESGSLTINAGGSVSLYDAGGSIWSYGTPGTPVSGVTLTGYGTATVTAPEAWFTLDSATYAMPAGFYTLAFHIPATGSDEIARTYKPEIGIDLQALP